MRSGTRPVDDAQTADLLRHVRRMGARVERDLDDLRDLEKRFDDDSVTDESLASQHFHIDVGGDTNALLGASASDRRKIIYYPREKFPERPRPKNVSGTMARTPSLDWFIQPYGHFWTLWSALVVILSVYELLMVPIVIGWPFLGNVGMYVWDYVVDTLFVMDLVLLFFVAQTPHTYYLATDRRRIVLSYAWGWFMVDLIASLPLDLFVWAANGTQARDFTRLLKVLHIFRLFRAWHQLAKRVKERWNSYNEQWVLYNPGIERLSGLALLIYLLCSGAGSFYAAYSTAVGFGASFFSMPLTLQGASFGTQYLYGFTWAFYAFFGGGTLQAIRPGSVGELFFALIMAVLGLALVIALVAGTVGLLAALDAHRARWREAQQRLNFSQKRKEVQLWLRAMLAGEPLFKGAEPSALHALAMRCKFKAFPRGAALVAEGQPPGAVLFLLRKGVVEESRDGVHQAYIGAGSSLNAQGLVKPLIVAGTSLTAARHAELFLLRRRDMLKVAQMYPRFAALLAVRM